MRTQSPLVIIIWAIGDNLQKAKNNSALQQESVSIKVLLWKESSVRILFPSIWTYQYCIVFTGLSLYTVLLFHSLTRYVVNCSAFYREKTQCLAGNSLNLDPGLQSPHSTMSIKLAFHYCNLKRLWLLILNFAMLQLWGKNIYGQFVTTLQWTGRSKLKGTAECWAKAF